MSGAHDPRWLRRSARGVRLGHARGATVTDHPRRLQALRAVADSYGEDTPTVSSARSRAISPCWRASPPLSGGMGAFVVRRRALPERLPAEDLALLTVATFRLAAW